MNRLRLVIFTIVLVFAQKSAFCQHPLDTLMTQGYSVDFCEIVHEYGSVAMLDSACIDGVVKYLKFHTESTIELYSHADSIGSPVINKALSERRAEFVAEYIIQHGIEASRVKYFGVGEDRPLQKTSVQVNRRTIFMFRPAFKRAIAEKVTTCFRLCNVYHYFGKVDVINMGCIDSVAQLLIDVPDFIVDVYSHTDKIGDSTYNLELSNKRAKLVASYLMQKGVPEDRITYHGIGDKFPASRSNNLLNRRTEFRILSLKDTERTPKE